MDKDTINKFINGSEVAFSIVYDLHADKVLRLARRKLDTEQEAQDFVQDLFIHVWQRREKFKVADNFEAYLFGIVNNLIKTEEDKKINRKRLDKKRLSESPPAVSTDMNDLFTEPDTKNIVEIVLSSTTPRRRLIYKLSREEMLPVKEIAARLDLKVQTVHNEITTILKMLRPYLKPHLG
jgi:RNA polymerase sigma factor (sigma-70 family)